MEKLHLRSDGICETPSGLLAIIPLYRSGVRDGLAWFEYRTGAMTGVTRIEWPSETDFVVLPAEVASGMILLGYGRSPTAAEVEAYNEVVDVYLKALTENAEPPSAMSGTGDGKTK